MPDHEVTLGEVYRRQQETLAEVREMRRDLIGRAEYESDQEHIDRRFVNSDQVHVALQTEIESVKSRIDRTETEQRQAKSKWQQSLVLACLAGVIAVIFPLMIGGLLG